VFGECWEVAEPATELPTTRPSDKRPWRAYASVSPPSPSCHTGFDRPVSYQAAVRMHEDMPISFGRRHSPW